MLDPEEAKRPSAADCLQLRWLKEQPLSPAQAAALERAAAAQAAAEAQHARDPPLRLGASKTAPGQWRDAEMRALVARGAKAGPRDEGVERLALLPPAGGERPSWSRSRQGKLSGGGGGGGGGSSSGLGDAQPAAVAAAAAPAADAAQPAAAACAAAPPPAAAAYV